MRGDESLASVLVCRNDIGTAGKCGSTQTASRPSLYFGGFQEKWRMALNEQNAERKKRQDVPCLMEAKAKPLSWLSYHFLGNAVSLSSLVTFNDSTLLFRLPVASHFRLASSFRCVSSFHSAFCVTVFQSRRFRRDGGGVDGNSSFQRITPILY